MSGKKILLGNMEASEIEKIAALYKQVFSGHPWHEDLICSKALEGKCFTQYSFDACEFYDGSSSGATNDCRESYTKRTSDGKQEIVLLPAKGLESCVGCGEKLKTIPYYPNYKNHFEIIDESLKKSGFVGVLAKDEKENLIGFSWGYLVPEQRTISVNFPKLKPLFEQKGVDPKECFYASEIGIIGPNQKQGVGGLLARARLLRSHVQDNPKFLVTRTINPMVHGYLKNIFSGNKGVEFFKDPETVATWFAWDFKDFNREEVEKRLEQGLKNPEII